MPAGKQKVNVSLSDQGSGVYFCRITALSGTDGRPQIIHHKIVLIR
jgi:hypothetical protein